MPMEVCDGAQQLMMVDGVSPTLRKRLKMDPPAVPSVKYWRAADRIRFDPSRFVRTTIRNKSAHHLFRCPQA